MAFKFTFRTPGFGYLLFSILTLSLLCTSQGVAQTARIENLSKIPGTQRGFPAEDYFTFHRSDREKNSKDLVLDYSDRNRFRIHNDGSRTLNISRLTTTNTADFKVTGITIPSGGLDVAPGQYVEATFNFLTNYGTGRRLVTASLVMESNATNASSFRATLRGAYMTSVEGGAEINVQQVFDAFGFKTRMGVDNNGNLQTRPSSDFPSATRVNSGLEGDFILSANFVSADPNKPVNLIQMAAFHGPGGAPTEFRDPVTAQVVGDIRYSHDVRNHQTLLPKADGLAKNAGDFAPSITKAWEIMVAGYRTSGGNRLNELKDKILGTRVYKVRDRNGEVVPNEYIVIQDYIENGCGAGSANCDWNDNVSYIVNMRPQQKPSAGKIDDVLTSAGKLKTFDAAVAFNRGYPGNQFTFSISLSSGGSLPNWISIDKTSGEVRIYPPNGVPSQKLGLRVTATDENKLRVSSDFALTIDGTTVDPVVPIAGTYWLEAECATVGSRWTKVKSSLAANGEFVVVQNGTSYGSPPTDEASRVRFTLGNASAGSYSLFTRTDAPGPLSDSYWVRINDGSWFSWNSGFAIGDGFQWNEFPDNQILLKSGTNTIDFAFREDGTRLDKILVTTPGSDPTGMGGQASNCDVPAGEGYATVEAECAIVGSGWNNFANSSASNGYYAEFTGDRRIDKPTSDEPAQQILFDVSVTDAGTYYLYTRIHAPDQSKNSVWVKVDNGSWIKFWEEAGGRNLLTAGFEWKRVADDGNAISFNLSSGGHTIRIANREPGTRIDKISLLATTTLPTGTGATAATCRPAASTFPLMPSSIVAASPQLDLDESSVRLYPNPASHLVNFSLESSFEGMVSVVMTDLTGRRVRDLRFEKSGRTLVTDIDISELPTGMYYLRILEGEQQTVRPLIKR